MSELLWTWPPYLHSLVTAQKFNACSHWTSHQHYIQAILYIAIANHTNLEPVKMQVLLVATLLMECL